MNERFRRSEFHIGRNLVLNDFETASGITERWRCPGVVLRRTDGHGGSNGNATVCAAMPGIIAPSDPCSALKVEDTDVVQPGVVKVLSPDDEQLVGSDSRQVCIARARYVGLGALLQGRRRNPALRRQIKEMDVVENAEVVRVLRFWLVGHAAKDNEMVVPWAWLRGNPESK